jgi:outer membrane protein TolC
MRLIPMTFFLFAGSLLWTNTAMGAEPRNLEDLVAITLKRNPSLDELEAQVAALEHRVTQAGAWKDPRLAVAYRNVPWDSFALGQEPMSMLNFRLEQTVPFFGKTAKRERVFEKAVQAKRWELEELRTQLRALVERAYYQLALARQLKILTGQHISLVEQLIDAVRIKYEVGKAPQRDLLRLQVLRNRLSDEIEDYDRRDQQLTAAINATLHRRVDIPVETPKTFEVGAPSLTVEQLQKLAKEHRPALKQLVATVNMHRAAGDLAGYEAIPDPTFFAAYGLRTDLPGDNEGRDLVTLGISLPLPVFYGSRYGAKADESAAAASATDARRKALDDTIAGGLAEALAVWRRAARQVTTYREQLVPEAHRALDATFASYQVGRAGFLSLYEAELELLNFEKTIRVAAVQALVAQTNIEMLIGRKLP